MKSLPSSFYAILCSLLVATCARAYAPCTKVIPLDAKPAAAAPPGYLLEPAGQTAHAFHVRFPAGTPAGELTQWEPLSTAGWEREKGLGFTFEPDGSSRYLDLIMTDPKTGETFRYAISTRFQVPHEVFVPFELLVHEKVHFAPTEHAAVALGWQLSKAPDTEMSFAVGSFFIGHLEPGEFVWPASVPPFVGTAVYLETFDGPRRDVETAGVEASLKQGPPRLGMAHALGISFSSSQGVARWTFADVTGWYTFDGMSIWFRGDGQANTLDLVLEASPREGKGTRTFTHHLMTDGKGWQVEHIEWDDFVDSQAKNFEPDEFRGLTLEVRPAATTHFPLKVVIGPFRLDDE